jgi:hypothetical protein
MYVRFNTDNKGRIRLQQYVSYTNNKSESGRWENVPLTGLGETSISDVPLGFSCGVFLIQEKITTNGITFNKVNIVSASSISNIIDIGKDKTRINIGQKEYYIINIDQISFIKILIPMLENFTIISINSDGEIEKNKEHL